MIQRIYRLATATAGLILLHGAYVSAPGIVAHADPGNAGLAAITAIGFGLWGMAAGAALVAFAVLASEER